MSVAAHFGLTAAEVRMKANYSVPEIWFAEEDRGALKETATALGEAGLKIVVVDGGALIDVPAQEAATSVAFEDDGLRIGINGSEDIVPFAPTRLGWFISRALPGLLNLSGRPAVTDCSSSNRPTAN